MYEVLDKVLDLDWEGWDRVVGDKVFDWDGAIVMEFLVLDWEGAVVEGFLDLELELSCFSFFDHSFSPLPS